MVNVDPQPSSDCEVEPALMVPDDSLARHGETLTGSLANLFGGEERIKDALAELLRNPAAVVGDCDRDSIAMIFGRNRDLAEIAAMFTDGVGGVYDQIEDDLSQLLFENLDHGEALLEGK